MTEHTHGGDPPSNTTVLVAIISTILLLAVVMTAVVIFQNVQYYEDQTKVYTGSPRELADLQFKQLATINESRWVSEKDGIVAIPIDDAIRLYAERVQDDAGGATIEQAGQEKGNQ